MKTQIKLLFCFSLILLLGNCHRENDQMELERVVNLNKSIESGSDDCEGTLTITQIWPSNAQFDLSMNAFACGQENNSSIISSWNNSSGLMFFFDASHDQSHFVHVELVTPSEDPWIKVEVTYPNGITENFKLFNGENSDNTHVLCPAIDWRFDCPGTDKD